MDRHEESRNDRLARLLPRIQSQAIHYVTRYRPDLDPPEIVQEACLSYLKRADANPAFLEQDDNAVVNRVVKDGWNAVRHQRHQEGWQVPLTLERDDGEEFNGLEFVFASDGPGPEEIAIAADQAERMRQAIIELKPSYQAVARGIMAGLPKGKIMEGIGAKPQAFQHYRRMLANALVEVI